MLGKGRPSQKIDRYYTLSGGTRRYNSGRPAAVICKDNAMDNDRDSGRPVWRFFDGSVSISISMLLAVAVNYCGACAGVPVLGFLHGLSQRDDGIIIVGTLLLLPTTAAFYGGTKMFFAAKEEYERRKAKRLREEEALQEKLAAERRQKDEEYKQRLTESGRQEGIQQERQRINNLLSEHDVPLPPEVARILVGDMEIGRLEGIRQERQRIGKLLAEYGDSVPPELARSLAGDTD